MLIYGEGTILPVRVLLAGNDYMVTKESPVRERRGAGWELDVQQPCQVSGKKQMMLSGENNS